MYVEFTRFVSYRNNFTLNDLYISSWIDILEIHTININNKLMQISCEPLLTWDIFKVLAIV